MTKFCLISDTHTFHNNFTIPECDVLIHAGDFTNVGSAIDVLNFLEWLKIQPAKHIVFIAGNHDKSFDQKEMKMFPSLYSFVRDQIDNLPPHIHYLQDSGVELEGFKFWGSPYSPSFENWAFNADRGEEIKKKWAKIPKNTNILVTHGGPMGILDYIPDSYLQPGQSNNVGCADLLERLKKLDQLKLNVFGHIHDNFGIKQEAITNTKRVLFANAAVLSNIYKPIIKYPHILNLVL